MPEVIEMAARFRLGALLEERGMSQSELARRSGITFATINAMTRNRTTGVQLDTLDRLARALGVEPGALIERVRKRNVK
jgi:putative transcriptional regulator